MVFIENKEEIEAFYPKNTAESSDSYALLLKSLITHEILRFEVEDLGTYSNYYIFKIDFSDVKEGDYEYEIKSTEGDIVYDRGMLRLGKIEHAAEAEYQSENNTYIEYDG